MADLNPTVSDAQRRLIEAGKKVFCELGDPYAPVTKIVEVAQMSKRDFYKFYKSKEALYLDVVTELLQASAPKAPDLEGNLQEVLTRVARASYTRHLNNTDLFLFRSAIAWSRKSTSLSRKVHEARARNSLSVAQYLEKCAASGEVVLDDSLLTALRFGFLAVDGSRHIMGLPPRGHEDQVAFIGDLTRAFIHGHATNALRSDSLHRPPTSVKLKLQTSSRELIDSSKSRLATGNWERILRIAWQEFTSKPFKEASVDRIAKASETPKSTLYRQFSSKESLYSAATKLILLDGLQRPLTFDWRRESASDALVTTAQHLLRTFTATDSKRTHRHLIAEAGEIPSVTSEVYEFYRHIIVEFTRPLLQALRQAGLIRNLPIEVVAWRLFIMSTIGNRFLFYSPGDAKQRRQLAEGATHQFLFGLVPGSESEWSA